jgi:hypothetical protein
MRIILSRKGFDSASGGVPSPIFPDGRMLSLPIPDKQSGIKYESIHWHEYNLGQIVCSLTNGRIRSDYSAHLDPDLNAASLPREAGWTPVHGQTGSAQGHLRNWHVSEGDLFLFFGLFREIENENGLLLWKKGSPSRHVIWGWMRIGQIIPLEGQLQNVPRWALYHPHLHGNRGRNNTLYIAEQAGIFADYSERLQLTKVNAPSPSVWQLPAWMFPLDGRTPLSYHSDCSRWRKTGNMVELHSASRGQNFVLDACEYPASDDWLHSLIL